MEVNLDCTNIGDHFFNSRRFIIGVNGVKVWDLTAMKEIEIPQQPFHERGQVSCICWVTRQNDVFETFCYGNALGYFIFLQHSPTEVSVLLLPLWI